MRGRTAAGSAARTPPPGPGSSPIPLRGASSPGAGELGAPLSADAQGAAPTPRTALAQVPGSLDAGGRTEPGARAVRAGRSPQAGPAAPRGPPMSPALVLSPTSQTQPEASAYRSRRGWQGLGRLGPAAAGSDGAGRE
ncbi:cuticle collagen 2-like [Balaenoptera ricei]|uniref:cuticle collagen 2-like n=1 Tax=Balaenoptera ricei TaxID=2746895 RepID=UPI0028BE007E|nr:cuticle collagen 2-like [Balaenoptera ricei]